MAAGVHDAEDRVGDGTFQGASGQAAIGFLVANSSLDRASSAEVDDFFGRQYTRIMRDRVPSIGLEPSAYGTDSMRRIKVAQIYKKIGNPP